MKPISTLGKVGESVGENLSIHETLQKNHYLGWWNTVRQTSITGVKIYVVSEMINQVFHISPTETLKSEKW